MSEAKPQNSSSNPTRSRVEHKHKWTDNGEESNFCIDCRLPKLIEISVITLIECCDCQKLKKTVILVDGVAPFCLDCYVG